MEIIVYLMVGLLCWTSCWLIVSGNDAGEGVLQARLQLVLHALRRVVSVVSGLGMLDALLRWEGFCQASSYIERRCAKLSHPLTRRESAAALLVLMLMAIPVGAMLTQSLFAGMLIEGLVVVGLQTRSGAHKKALALELSRGMPGVLRTLATALGAGHTLVQAIEYVGLSEKGAISEPFARASLRLRCGMSVESALAELERELQAPGVDLMVTALTISQRTGSPLRDLFHRSALMVEEHGEQERLLAVRTAQVRLSVRIVCCLPPLMVCVLSLISPDFREGLASSAGITSLSLAALMDGAALLIIRRILEGVL